ncbi:hypothetical protein Poli38472_014281 [Pythium oligandrum]|uniref:FYVE-type domain-containing protein n=1 Tax=Pythium oligandrum TaxID=41045 RepID=A0A8K1CIF9_PYTOL|nr:hypothetical protein Poli38472_014281 [Pythium oligandrum]|eukprot:TMW64164.1 hypothetical protein Poli38472_014281 [Pythium oligandrum]
MLRTNGKDFMSLPDRMDAARPPKTSHTANGVPVLQLTTEQEDELRNVEQQLLTQYLARYEEHTTQQNRSVDFRHWKLVRQAQGVKAYRRRNHAPRPDGEAAAASIAPMMLVLGSIEGTMEDALYGSIWNSRDERGMRTYYTKDGVTDAAVLYTVEHPTITKPFRSLALKWSHKRASRSAALIKDRDFVFLGATGILRQRNGERIGYELLHSLKIPAFPPIGDGTIVRAELLSCSFYRPLQGGRVEVFHQVSFNAGGDLLSMLAWNQAIELFVSLAAVIECSINKKLVRAVTWSHEHRRAQVWDRQDRRCGHCSKSVVSLERKCGLCHHLVCPPCSVRRDIFPPRHGLPPVARIFCKTCLTTVIRDDASKYILRDIFEFERRAAAARELDDASSAGSERRDLLGALPQRPDITRETLTVRRRQGSLPVAATMLSTRTSVVQQPQSRRMTVPGPTPPPTRRLLTDENMAPNSAPQDLISMRTSRRFSSAVTHRAVNGDEVPSSEIVLRSDADQRKWRNRALTVGIEAPPQSLPVPLQSPPPSRSPARSPPPSRSPVRSPQRTRSPVRSPQRTRSSERSLGQQAIARKRAENVATLSRRASVQYRPRPPFVPIRQDSDRTITLDGLDYQEVQPISFPSRRYSLTSDEERVLKAEDQFQTISPPPVPSPISTSPLSSLPTPLSSKEELARSDKIAELCELARMAPDFSLSTTSLEVRHSH